MMACVEDAKKWLNKEKSPRNLEGSFLSSSKEKILELRAYWIRMEFVLGRYI